MALDAHRVAGRIRGKDHSSLRSQIMRAAGSVPANIVEGSGQLHAREFSRYLRIALNSTTELEYHLIIARDLKLITESSSLTLISQAIEVRKMIYGLLRHLASQTEDRGGTPRKDMNPA